jgi:diguanylate cyclase (GGDEF)-like protein
MSKKNEHKLPSLRKRYLTLASLATAALLVGTTVASWYIHQASSNSVSAVALNESVTKTVFELRNAMTSIDMTLNSMLIHPQDSDVAALEQNLQLAQKLGQLLLSRTDANSAILKLPVTHLTQLVNTLNGKVHYLITKRKEKQWVYPILPYITSELLTPHENFTSAVELALDEYQNEDLDIDETYFQLQMLRNLWQKKILNFRAVLVRFIGLDVSDSAMQEAQIDKLHDQIETLLAQLKFKQNNDELDLQVDASLSIMIEASRLWDQSWRSAKNLKNLSAWRGDVAYLYDEIKPVQIQTTLVLQALEKIIHDWSSQQTDKLTTAARQIGAELWLFALVAILFVIAVYMMIEKLVLRPTTRIAQSLSQERLDNYFYIEDKSSKEIFLLTDAFNKMRKQIHQRQLALEHQALHDALTGLPNRILHNDRLIQAIEIMKRTQDKLAVLLLDLDRFKDVNDTLGHHVGDELLQLVAKRLEETVINTGTVARLGGDEFAIIAPDISSAEALDFANKINAALKGVFIIGHQNLYVGASIGISIYPDDGIDSHTMMRHADTAMYTAKYNNYNAVLYEASQDKHTANNLSLVGDLRKAIENRTNLSMFYQPQVDLLSLDVVQVEALLRWNHPTKGYVHPEEIINLAEKTGLIKDLTNLIIETSIREYMQHIFEHNIRLAINLSAWNLQDPDLHATVQELLTRYKMPAEMLTLEITETTMMKDPVQAREALNRLNKMGVILAIDDYGTGFSSLSYLKLLPVHELKIDKSFIFDMLDDDNDATIVKSTIELAHNLGFKVIAEGVENQQTLLQLRHLKCETVQGYYLSKPQDINALTQWLQNYNAKIAL